MSREPSESPLSDDVIFDIVGGAVLEWRAKKVSEKFGPFDFFLVEGW